MKLITLNIGNPSLERAKKQVNWIENIDADIYVLTETKLSKGCLYIENYFSSKSIFPFNSMKEDTYSVYFPKSHTGDLGVMIISKYPIKKIKKCFGENNPYFSRVLDVVIDFGDIDFGIMGLYVPSRDMTQTKIDRKKNFVIDYLDYIKKNSKKSTIPYIICGDLNVLERNHFPKYKNYFEWEYDFYEQFEYFGYVDVFRYLYPNKNEHSWVGRTNNGYRYDHIFVSKSLVTNIEECYYIHDTRKTSITDHSAMVVVINTNIIGREV